MHVRNATPADFKAILQISHDIYSTIENKAHFNWTASVLTEELKSVQTLVVESEGDIKSFLCYRDLKDVYEISVLATAIFVQRNNFQATLIGFLQEFAATSQRTIILEVHAENQKAIALYKKMGFMLLHIRKQYYHDLADALVMSWSSNKAGC